ncbi:MAG: hypothetical protein WCE21_03535, partial [Candidatus Babeliales bacterium]
MNALFLILLTSVTYHAYASDAPRLIKLDGSLVELVIPQNEADEISLIPFYKKTYTFGKAGSRRIMQLATPTECTYDFDVVSLDNGGA